MRSSLEAAAEAGEGGGPRVSVDARPQHDAGSMSDWLTGWSLLIDVQTTGVSDGRWPMAAFPPSPSIPLHIGESGASDLLHVCSSWGVAYV